MSNLRDLSEQPPIPQDLSDIIDRYASPAPSPSSSVHHQHNDGLSPGHGHEYDSVHSMSSSPPPHGSMSVHSRASSTNSGHLRRTELFSRDSHARTPGPVALSQALSFFHGSTAPDHDQSSPLARFQAGDSRAPQQRPSSRSPPVPASGTSSIRSSRSFGHASRTSAADEWMIAGGSLQESSTAGVYGQGANSPAKKTYGAVVSRESDVDEFRPLFATKIPARKISAAEEALRSSLAANVQSSKPTQDRQSSWMGRLFARKSPEEPLRSSSPKSVLSDDNISEFEYVAPDTPEESPEAILDRIRARGAALKEQSSTDSLATTSSFVSEQWSDYDPGDPKYEDLAVRSPHQAQSLLSLEASSVHDSISSGGSVSSIASLESLPPQFPDGEDAVAEGEEAQVCKNVNESEQHVPDEHEELAAPSLHGTQSWRSLDAISVHGPMSSGGATPSTTSLEALAPQSGDEENAIAEAGETQPCEDAHKSQQQMANSGEALAVSSPHQAQSLFSTSASSMHESISSAGSTPLTTSLEPLPPQFADEKSAVADAGNADVHEHTTGPQQDTPPSEAPTSPLAISVISDTTTETSSVEAHAAELALSPISAVATEILPVADQALDFSNMITVIDQAPRTVPQPELTMSPISILIGQVPVAPRASKGLSFAAANAIVYGSTTLAATTFICLNITNDFQCNALATDMGIAFLMSVIVCFVLHVGLVVKFSTWRAALWALVC